MKDNTGFFKTTEDRERGWMLNIYPIKILTGTQVEINDNKNNITPGTRKLLVDSTHKVAKSMKENDRLVFRYISQKTNYYKRKTSKGLMSGRDRYIRNELDHDVKRSLNLDTKLSGKGIHEIIIPSNIIDIYTR